VRKQVAEFRRVVESAVQERHGGIGVYHAKVTRTAAIGLRQSLVIGRILADNGEPGGEKLSHEQWMGYSDRLLRAEQTVDKALKDLGLDRKPGPADWLDDFYKQARTAPTSPPASPVLPTGTNSQPSASDAAGATPEAPATDSTGQGVTP